MGIDEQLAQAIFELHPSDLSIIRKYISWVKFRRKVNHTFYPSVHWVLSKPRPNAHWVGR